MAKNSFRTKIWKSRSRNDPEVSNWKDYILLLLWHKNNYVPINIRSSDRKCYIKQAVLKNLAIFRDLCWSLFFIKFVKERLQRRCFPVNIVKLLRALILCNSCEWLLLNHLGILNPCESAKSAFLITVPLN